MMIKNKEAHSSSKTKNSSRSSNSSPLKIRPNTIKLADWCARELWRGYKYHDGKITTSDDYLLYKFSTSVRKYQNALTKSVIIKKIDFNALMSATHIRLSSYKKFSMRKGILNFPNQIDVYEYLYIFYPRRDRNFHFFMPCFVYDVGRDFYKGVTIHPHNGCFAALASRLLFFAVPELPIFNYSSKLSKSFGLKSALPAKTLDPYYDFVAAGYINHWSELKKYHMPLSDFLDDDHWLSIKESGWWQRRIFDIALLLHFGLFNASKFMNTIPLTPNRKYL